MSESLGERENSSGNTCSKGNCFHSILSSPNFHKCLCNSMGTRKKILLLHTKKLRPILCLQRVKRNTAYRQSLRVLYKCCFTKIHVTFFFSYKLFKSTKEKRTFKPFGYVGIFKLQPFFLWIGKSFYDTICRFRSRFHKQIEREGIDPYVSSIQLLVC